MTITFTIPDYMGEAVAKRASELGYSTPDDYLLALLKADIEDEEVTPEQIIADIKQAVRDIKNGNVMSIEELEVYLESPDDDAR
jgi:hypothetical protein